MRLLVSRHLENFIALYEAQNMHAAADRKGISQPALAKSLRIVEEEVGTRLFFRTSKGLEPTRAGDTLYRYARAIDQEARFAAFDVHNSMQEIEGRLQLGIGPALAVSSFPSVLLAFHEAFPSAEVTVETGITSHLVENLVQGNLDVVVTARPSRALPEQFVGLHLFSNDMVAVCRSDHPVRKRGIVGIEDLSPFGRVGFIEDHEFDKHARKALGPGGDKMPAAVQTTSMTVILDILAATDYFAILSEVLLPKARMQGLLPIALRDQLWRIDIDLMCKQAIVDSRPVKTIRNAWLDYVAAAAVPAGARTAGLNAAP